MKSHRDIERRSLELHRAVARKLLDHPIYIDTMRRNLAKMLEQGGQLDYYSTRWSEILSRSLEEIVELLQEDSEKMRELRQSSPCSGILSPRERWKIYEAFSNRTSH